MFFRYGKPPHPDQKQDPPPYCLQELQLQFSTLREHKYFKIKSEDPQYLQIFLDCFMKHEYILKLRLKFSADEALEKKSEKLLKATDVIPDSMQITVNELLDKEFLKENITFEFYLHNQFSNRVKAYVCKTDKTTNKNHTTAQEKVKHCYETFCSDLEKFLLENTFSLNRKRQSFVLDSFQKTTTFSNYDEFHKQMFTELLTNYECETIGDTRISLRDFVKNFKGSKRFRTTLVEENTKSSKKMKTMLESSSYEPNENDPVFMTDNNVLIHILSYCDMTDILQVSCCSNFMRYFVKQNIDMIVPNFQFVVPLSNLRSGFVAVFKKEELNSLKTYAFFKYHSNETMLQIESQFLSQKQHHAATFSSIKQFLKKVVFATPVVTVPIVNYRWKKSKHIKEYTLFDYYKFKQADPTMLARRVLIDLKGDYFRSTFQHTMDFTMIPTNTVVFYEWMFGVPFQMMVGLRKFTWETLSRIEFRNYVTNLYWYLLVDTPNDLLPEAVPSNVFDNDKFCVIVDGGNCIVIRKGKTIVTISSNKSHGVVEVPDRMPTRSLHQYETGALTMEQLELCRKVFADVFDVQKPSQILSE